jgi:murein L,D-transpeptidase YcbB/YkuD
MSVDSHWEVGLSLLHRGITFKWLILLSIVTALLVHTNKDCGAIQSLSEEVREKLLNRINKASDPLRITVRGDLIRSPIALSRFYERGDYRSAWCDGNGPLPRVNELVTLIQNANLEGLNPTDYHLTVIRKILAKTFRKQTRKKPLNVAELTDLEFLLTDGFLLFASHLLSGRINPEFIDPEWDANRREADLASILQTAVDWNRIGESFEIILPPHSGYHGMRRALALYRKIAARNGWSLVPSGPKMLKDMRDKRVQAVRSRLVAEGYLDPGSSVDEELFDSSLGEAVRRFQERHGLDVDGVVGAATLTELNVPIKDRIRQIKLNMERWRWLPQDLGVRYILVNIASFQLEVIERGRKVINMRVVVGRDYRHTPVFSGKMTHLVLNPYWYVPQKIAVEDKLPLIRKDPGYLASHRMKVLNGWGPDAEEIDPGNIEWFKVNAKNFSYVLRQEPGPANELGQVKFIFPNRYNVYLHASPSSKVLFWKSVRTFSSGCIRIHKPIELAKYLLRGNPNWTREQILAAIEKGVEQRVDLSEPIPVHLLYWTAWVDENGSIQFRKDIYGRDKLLDEALKAAVHMPGDMNGSEITP